MKQKLLTRIVNAEMLIAFQDEVNANLAFGGGEQWVIKSITVTPMQSLSLSDPPIAPRSAPNPEGTPSPIVQARRLFSAVALVAVVLEAQAEEGKV
jgi:hypothetical protein